MFEYFIVALAVSAALLYCIWALMPAAMRRAAAAGLARRARLWGLGEPGMQRLQKNLEQGGACGACAACKGCTTVSTQPADPRA